MQYPRLQSYLSERTICGWGVREMVLSKSLLWPSAALLLSACSTVSTGEYSADRPELRQVSTDTANQTLIHDSKNADGTPAQGGAVRISPPPMIPISDPTSNAYKIGPRDILDVTVFKVPDLSKMVQVSEAGTINYPLVGELQAGGKTPRQIEKELTLLLGQRYLQNPQITVLIKENNSQRITVEGAVKKPGVYPINGGMSLLQAVATAGGFETNADETAIVVRPTSGQPSGMRFDVSKIRQGQSKDIPLEPGDIIIASTSDIKAGIEVLYKIAPLATLVPYL